MKWATNVSSLLFFIIFICIRFFGIQCELTISQFCCNNTWNPRIPANSKTIVQSLCNLNLQLSFIETDANKSSSANGQVTVDLLVTSGFETLRATSIPGVDYWTVATLTTSINLDSRDNNNNDTFHVQLNHLTMQVPSICGQTFMIARVKQPDDPTVDRSIPIEVECLEKNVDLALEGETKDSYDMYIRRPVISTTGQPISHFIPEFKLWVKNSMPNETFSSRTGPSVYVVSAYLKPQLWYMFKWSHGNESGQTVAHAENGQLNYQLDDVLLHKGNRLVSSHGGRGTPSMPSGYRVALEVDQMVLRSQKVCGNGLIVVKLSVPHSPSDSNLFNNYYLLPVFIDCWGHNPEQIVETCKVVPNYYDGGQTAWITYTVPGQTKIFEYKSEERSVRPVHIEVESAAVEDVSLMKLTTDIQSDRLQLIDQCVDTLSGGSDTFVTSLEVLLSGVEKSWAEMKSENEIQKVEHDKISLILAAVSEVLTLALQLKNPLNGWLHIPFYLAFSSEGHVWEDEHLASNQVSRKMKRDVDELGDEQMGDNEVEEFGNEEEGSLDEGDESEGVEEYAYEANGTTNKDGIIIRRMRRAAGEATTSTSGRTTPATQQRSGNAVTTTQASTGRTSARSTSPSSVTASSEAQLARGGSVTTTTRSGTTKASSGSGPSSDVTTSRSAVTEAGQRGTTPKSSDINTGPSKTSRSEFSATDRSTSGSSSSTTPSSSRAGATTSRLSTGSPASGSTRTPSTSRGSTQQFARLEATSSFSPLGSSGTVRSTTGRSVTSRYSTAPSVSSISGTSSSTSGSLHSPGNTAGAGTTSNVPAGTFAPTKASAGTTGRMTTGTSRFNSQTTMGSSGSTQVGTEGLNSGPTLITTTSSTEMNDNSYFGRKPSWHQDVSKIIYGVIKYDGSLLASYLSSDRIQAISHFFQTLFYGRTEDLNKYSYIPTSTLDKLTSLLKMVLSSSMPRIFDDIPQPLYQLIMKWYNSELVNKDTQVTGCTFRAGIEMFLNATERMQMTKEWDSRKDQLTLYGHILQSLLQDDHPEYLADLYSKIMAAWSRNEAWMIRDGIPIHEPDVDDVCKRYTAAKLWQLHTPPVFQFAGRTVSPDQYKSVFWTEDRGTIFRGDRSALTGQVFWSKVATCSCTAGNTCGDGGGPIPSATAPPSTSPFPSLSVTSSSRWTDTTTASVPMTSGQATRNEDAMSAAPVYRYHDQFQIKDQRKNEKEEEEEFEIHEDLLFSD